VRGFRLPTIVQICTGVTAEEHRDSRLEKPTSSLASSASPPNRLSCARPAPSAVPSLRRRRFPLWSSSRGDACRLIFRRSAPPLRRPLEGLDSSVQFVTFCNQQVEDLVNGHEVLRVTRRGNGISPSASANLCRPGAGRRGPAKTAESFKTLQNASPMDTIRAARDVSKPPRPDQRSSTRKLSLPRCFRYGPRRSRKLRSQPG